MKCHKKTRDVGKYLKWLHRHDSERITMENGATIRWVIDKDEEPYKGSHVPVEIELNSFDLPKRVAKRVRQAINKSQRL